MNNIGNKKGGMAGQTCGRKLKRTVFVVFENLLAKQFFRQSSFLPFVMTEIMFGRHLLDTKLYFVIHK